MSSSGSFFPRIESVFYAVFDVRQGPKIIYQVPEGLIATGPPSLPSTATLNSLSPPSPEAPSVTASPSLLRLDSARTLTGNDPGSPHVRVESTSASASSCRPLFHFDDISKYVIPHRTLCGRLVICATRRHRILGFPVELRGNYDRNYFRYNLCFVFDRTADLSCYEPIVRKVSRVLTACEEESAFLSSPQSSRTLHAILEQLYEDLNSYSETSIPMDKFNSIELKIFPFYPNPPPVKDYMVPLALINLAKRVEPNWDLTMVKVCQYINGVNHVSRIARLADCDLDLTRQAIAHLLYYQVIMMIDIFQYSNMYTLRTSIQRLADESHVRDECGPYATKPGETIADWPKLLHLYSRLKPGKTVREWMDEYNVLSYGLDVRRFTSFGVIKGFLRRVHRWPVLLPGRDALSTDTQGHDQSSSLERRRGQSFAAENSEPFTRQTVNRSDSMRVRGRPQEPSPTVTSVGAEIIAIRPTAALSGPTRARSPLQRHPSAAENSLGQLRNRGITVRKPTMEQILNPSSNPHPHSAADPAPFSRVTPVTRQDQSSHLPMSNTLTKTASSSSAPGSSDMQQYYNATNGGGGTHAMNATLGLLRPRISRSPSAPVVSQVHAQVPAGPSFPRELLPLLDGEHHTDELCTRFEVGWPVLKQWLVLAGGGKDDGDFGRVEIIYR